ncbi:MAG: hypothetical protein ACREFW_04580 [Rhizomicrobium sp.]
MNISIVTTTHKGGNGSMLSHRQSELESLAVHCRTGGADMSAALGGVIEEIAGESERRMLEGLVGLLDRSP